MAAEYLSKTRAIILISAQTGYGRRVIENKMNELSAQGLIALIPDPGDKRAQLIKRAEVEIVIRALTPGETL